VKLCDNGHHGIAWVSASAWQVSAVKMLGSIMKNLFFYDHMIAGQCNMMLRLGMFVRFAFFQHLPK